MAFKLQDPGCPCCGGICTSEDPPAPIQTFADDFSTDLSQWSVLGGSAAIFGGQLLLTRTGTNPLIVSPKMGCNRSGFAMDFSIEMHGVLDSLTGAPAGSVSISTASPLLGFSLLHLWKSPGSTFPNAGRYIMANGGMVFAAEPDIPVAGDVFSVSVENIGTHFEWSMSLNGSVRHSGATPLGDNPERLCRWYIRLGLYTGNIGAQPNGPDYLFDNVIASMTCNG